MTPPSLLRPSQRPSHGLPPRQPVRPSFRPVPLPDRRFQKRPVTTSPRPHTLPSSMTVCIAFASSRLKKIITVSDMKIETQTSSMEEAMVKWRHSQFGWHCLFATSTDISRFESIWKRFNDVLKSHGHAIAVADVENAIESAYRAERRHMAEVSILNPWTMDLPTFELQGRMHLGDDLFTELHAKISALNTGVELLVFGFDGDSPVILQSSTSGAITNAGAIAPAFGAVGSGQYVALDSLYEHADFRGSFDIGYIIYRLCEAKFASEKTPGVGEHTSVAVFGQGSFGEITASTEILTDADIKAARALWKRRKRLPVPGRVLKSLRENLVVLSSAYLSFRSAKRVFYHFLKLGGVAVHKLQRLTDDGLIPPSDMTGVIANLTEEWLSARTVLVTDLEKWELSGKEPSTFADASERLAAAAVRLDEISKEFRKKKRD